MSTFTPSVTLNVVKIKSQNRRITIHRKIDDKTNIAEPNKNVIHLKALTSEVGDDPGVRHALSENGKIKESLIGLTDDALKELYTALHIHFTTLKRRDEMLLELLKE